MDMRVGLIGLGIMGKPMGKNLLKAGHELVVSDLNQAAVAELVAAGAKKAESNAALAADCQVVLTMLPNSPQVKQVVLDEGGLLGAMKPGQVLIDMSSINPLASREIAERLAARGIDMLDAPVSGGEPKAVDGSLAFMVGGRRETFDAYLPLLKAMGASVVYCGEIGAGNVAKLCNQVIVAVNIAAVSEALMLGQKAGVSPDLIYNAIRGGLAGSTVLDAKAPMIMDRNFKPGFKIDLHIKDLNNVLDAAKAVDAPMFLTNMAMEMMKMLHQAGEGGSDHSAIAKFYERVAATEIHR
ncbi:MAG: 2-hydroxy-3-oxopropionate reductase [Christensenellales bacterium]